MIVDSYLRYSSNNTLIHFLAFDIFLLLQPFYYNARIMIKFVYCPVEQIWRAFGDNRTINSPL